jgi:hypothetical protein
MFQNRVQRAILRTLEEIPGDWRKLHNGGASVSVLFAKY